MKKRTKKYRPKKVEAPAIVYRCLPDLSDEEIAKFEIIFRSHANAIQSPEGITADSITYLMDFFRIGYVLSHKFDNFADHQLLMLIAFASCAHIAKSKNKGSEIVKEIYKPIQAAVDVITDMHRLCHRDELILAIREVKHHRDDIIRVARGACFLVFPNDRSKVFFERRGAIYINGRVRTGYFIHNPKFNRLEWIDPIEDTKVPVLEPVIVIFAEPLTEQEIVEAEK